MQLEFTKMQGCGNDYIYLHLPNGEEGLDLGDLSVRLSHRNFGIGGDGIVLMLPPEDASEADIRMRMFNADGSEGRMCGNAIRCVAKYVYERGISKKPNLSIETLSGVKSLKLDIRDSIVSSVQVDMGAPLLDPGSIPTTLGGETPIISHAIQAGGSTHSITCVSMGNPHAVVFVEDLGALDLPAIGPLFEHHPIFPERVNTEFVRIVSPTRLGMRVWERGSGETLACGTGACAAVVAATLNGHCQRDTDVVVELVGGELSIRWSPDTVYMTGIATLVFDGVIDLKNFMQ